MSLVAGTRLGPYEVLSLIGAGGMGEVYRARDTRLNRDVAIKVLPAAFSSDPERLHRFEQEAPAAAALNHPNILAVYDIGRHESSPYIVSELLEGETLREHLNGGALPMRHAVEIAIQIAHGLAAAHEKGIVHRDLKPENVFVTRDDRVKILDFGLAKLTEGAAATGDASLLPTVFPETLPGVVLGTVSYMSPEQVRGQTLDQRSDIFSFGLILYEMLSGTRAFRGDSAIETMNAILKEDPPELSTKGRNVPGMLERILRRCLEKQPERRFRSAWDLSFALEALSMPSASEGVTAAAPEKGRKWMRAQLPAAAAGLIAGVALVFVLAGPGAWTDRPPGQESRSWTGSLLVGGSTIAWGPRVSPDGRMVAFLVMVGGLTQLGVLQANSGDWEVRTFDRSGYLRTAAWNGDGSRIFFDRAGGYRDRIFSVPAVGGEERLVLEDGKLADSLPDGSLLINRSIAGRYRLHRFWPDKARLEPLPVFPVDALSPQVRALPGGEQAVFYGHGESGDAADASPARLYRIDLTTKKIAPVRPNLELGTRFKEYTATLAGLALAVSPDARTIFVDIPSGDLHRVVEVPLDDRFPIRTLFTATAPALFLDAGGDGSVYFDQFQVNFEVVRTNVEGLPLEHLAGSTTPAEYCSAVMPLPDGRVVFPTRVSGRVRLFVGSAGKEPKPFVSTTEESSPPMALVGSDRVAFLLGRSPNQEIGLASVSDGRLTGRIELPRGTPINCVASSPDGQTLYYVTYRTLWTLPSGGGEPRRLVAADAVALHPKTGEIIVQRNDTGGVGFFRFDAFTGREQRIEIREAEAPPAGGPLSSRAIAPDGRVLLPIAPADRFAWDIGVLHPLSGLLKRVPMDYAGGLNSPAWTDDGHIVFPGGPFSGSIWRFRPSAETMPGR